AGQRAVAAALLQSLGYQVATVESGELAVEYIQDHHVDLVLLDMVMTGIDGAETYRRVLERNPNQRALIMSGYAESDRVALARQLGAGGFVPKPMTLAGLANEVRKELDRSSTPAAESANGAAATPRRR